MRIAVIHNLQSGGARRRLANQLVHLRDEVLEVCPSSASPITDNALVIPFLRFSERLPRITRPPARYLDLASMEAGWWRLRREVAKLNADVLYLNPCQFLQAPYVLGDGLPPAVYFCDEPRRFDAEESAGARVNSRTARLYSPIYRRMRALDHRVVTSVKSIATNSRYTASEIMRVYERPSTVLRLGVADSLTGSSSGGLASDFLLSVGTLIPGKGHETVIRAAAATRRHHAVTIIAPRGDRSERARLERLASDLNIHLDIRLSVSDQELSRAYASAFATLYLAEREPFGLVSLEAQAHGCPVVVANEGGLPETIIEGVTGWSTPRDPVVAAGFIDRLDDLEVRSAMSLSARSHGESWTWRRSSSELRVLLEQAAGATHDSARLPNVSIRQHRH
jgi:glycosyltransferase involved in cell wall biosynthesis